MAKNTCEHGNGIGSERRRKIILLSDWDNTLYEIFRKYLISVEYNTHRVVSQKLLFYGDPMREVSRIGGCARQNNVLPHDALSKWLWTTRKMLAAYN